MPGYNNSKISHSRRPIGLQHVIGKTLPQYHKGHPSAYHVVIKFPTTNGVGMVRGNQRIARECYSVDKLDMQDKVSIQPSPSEELEPVQLGDQPEHLIYIGSKLAEDIKSPLIRFLKHNMEVFT